MKEDDNFYNKFKSPIPPHLTPEEREEWEKQAKWEKEERERRKKEGLYRKYKRKRGIIRSWLGKIKLF